MRTIESLYHGEVFPVLDLFYIEGVKAVLLYEDGDDEAPYLCQSVYDCPYADYVEVIDTDPETGVVQVVKI